MGPLLLEINMGMFQLLPPAKIVKSYQDSMKALENLQNHKLLAVDTETTGLSRPKDRAIITAISNGIDRYAIWPEAVVHFQGILEDLNKDLVFHNANFDSWMLKNIGIDIYRDAPRKKYRAYDTMVMHALLNDADPHGLKPCSKWYLGIDMAPFKTTFGLGNGKVDLEDVLLREAPPEKVANYASLDAFATYKLYDKFYDYLTQMEASDGVSMWDYYTRYELPFTKVLWDMELNGFQIDADLLIGMVPDLEAEILEIKKWFGREFGMLYVNLNSNPEKIEIFHNRLGHPVKEYTESGDPSMSASVIKAWAAKGCEASEKYLRYADLNKQLGTYVLNNYKQIHTDGRIHATFHQTGARTGRLSSADPNLQNQAPFVREAYVAPHNFKIYAPDYSQLEMRILAHSSGDPTMCKAVIEGLDIHCATAATMFGLDYAKIKRAKDADDAGLTLSDSDRALLKKRKASKSIGFGLMYGQGAKALAATLGVTVQEAKGLMNKFFGALPSITDYFKDTIQGVHDTGYCSTILGRRRLLPNIHSYYSSDIARAERQTKNSPIQGSAADIVKCAMIKIFEDPLIQSSGARMLVQVHDEIVFEVPEALSADHEFNNRVKDLMEHPLDFDLRIPLTISSKYGVNWLECK